MAAVLGAAAAATLAAAAVSTVATRPDLLMTSVEDTVLYRLAIPPVAAELDDSDMAGRINTGPLRLSRKDIERILVRRFGPEDLALKAREVHAGLIRYVRTYPRDTIFRISIRRERPILARAAEDRVLERFQALPECDLDDDVDALGRAGIQKLFEGSSDREFLEGLPNCRPPDAVAEPVMEGVQNEFQRLVLEENDSVDAFPDPSTGDLEGYSARITRIQTIDRFLGRAPWISLVLVGAVLLAVVAASRRTAFLPGGWALLFALGVGLAVSAGFLGLEELPGRVLEAFGGRPEDGDEIRRLWLDLGAYGVRRTLHTARNLVGIPGLVLTAGGAAGLIASGRSRGADP